MTDWFARDEFWEDTFDFMFPPSRMDEAGEEVSALLDSIGFAPERALDLCCGPGRAAIELPKRGLSVTGVDKSPFMLAKARERAATAGVDIEWVESDMREFETP
jgi:ubiquinone/menaquinone biosynthesis C-methylase UbiE